MKRINKIRRAAAGSSRKPRIRVARTPYTSRSRSRQAVPSRLAAVPKSARRRTFKTRHARASAQDAEKQRFDAQCQAAVKNFELAARAFQKQNYEKAKEIFEKLAGSEVRDVAERARVHLRLCQQKLSRPTRSPKTAEEYYVLGVGALNARRLDEAIDYLHKAHRVEPEREHIRYALAAAYALQGDTIAALDHLKAAITLRPANRIQARNDEDFHRLAADLRFKNLLSPS